MYHLCGRTIRKGEKKKKKKEKKKKEKRRFILGRSGIHALLLAHINRSEHGILTIRNPESRMEESR